MNYLDELNPHQKKAVLHKEGPLLILAGAGAGKTRTLTYRILHLIKEGVDPQKILAVTFTNKAAKEMRERIYNLLKEDQNLNLPVYLQARPFIKTFHSLGVTILKENFSALNLPKNFSILDKNDSQKIIKEIIVSLDLDPKEYEPKKILGIISKQKGQGMDYRNFKEKQSINYQNKQFFNLVASVWENYEKKLKKEACLDFDDLLLKPVILLKKEPTILNNYQKRWQYIHVDEYQDTNKTQYQMAKLLSEKHQNICVVGDADQNIYSWRGANIKNILNFEKDFKQAKTILLEENYRSTKNILEAANQIIKKNSLRQEKNLFTKNDDGSKLGIYLAFNESEEANFVAQKSKELIENEKISPKEIAVLYRTNFQSRILEEAFLNNNVPYQVLGTKFFDRKEIKDVIAYIKVAVNPDDVNSLKRAINTPPRGIGKVTLAKILSKKEGELSPKIREKIENFRNILKEIGEASSEIKSSELIKLSIEKSGIKTLYEKGTEDDFEKLANLKELVSLALKYDEFPPQEALEKLLEDVALTTDQDELEEEKNAVKLMTVHASKGLEFDYVFITGLEEGLFPSRMNTEKTKDKEEEERRLFYVALTRARKKLYLSYTSTRTIFGSHQNNTVSCFITDIDENLLEYANGEGLISDFDDEKIEYLEW